MKRAYKVVDMFCGAGGESTGIMQAAQEQGMKVNLTAINHWERAIETHATNHPSLEDTPVSHYEEIENGIKRISEKLDELLEKTLEAYKK